MKMGSCLMHVLRDTKQDFLNYLATFFLVYAQFY